MAEPDREPTQAQTHGGPFQDHGGGAEAKEGTPPHRPLHSLLPFWPFLELITNNEHTIQPGPH